MENWTNKGTAQTFNSIGRKLLTSDSSITAAYVRYKITVTGTGKAIFGASVNFSDQ